MNWIRKVGNAIRYWFFKESRDIDANAEEIRLSLENLKKATREFDEATSKVTQGDALRSLVISMNRAGRSD